MKLSILAGIVGNVLPVLHQPLYCFTCCKCNKTIRKQSSTVCTDFLVWVFSHPGLVLGQPLTWTCVCIRAPYQALIHSVWADQSAWASSRSAQGWISWSQLSPTLLQDNLQTGEQPAGRWGRAWGTRRDALNPLPTPFLPFAMVLWSWPGSRASTGPCAGLWPEVLLTPCDSYKSRSHWAFWVKPCSHPWREKPLGFYL